MAQVLTDKDPMPYGKHKGVAMANVPADYLLWLKKENKASDSVLAYINDSIEFLKSEK